jgi:cobalt-zinc-cadmium efflux system membrane fusion protein
MKQSSVRWQTFLALFSLWFLIGCGRGENQSPSVTAPKDSPSKTEANSGEAPLKLEPAMIAHLKIEPVSERRLPTTIAATGKIAFNEDRLARILAPVAGQVVNLRVKVGDGVAAGQPLFYVTSREASAAVTEYLENRKDLELASKTYDMTKDLYDHESASRIALQQAENDLAKAKARMARSEYALKALNLSVDGPPSDTKIPVQAPLGGKVVERAVTEGQFVQPDSNALMVIADLTNLWVLADIYETNLNRIKLGQKAEVTTAAYPDERFVATVSRISDVVSEQPHHQGAFSRG